MALICVEHKNTTKFITVDRFKEFKLTDNKAEAVVFSSEETALIALNIAKMKYPSSKITIRETV